MDANDEMDGVLVREAIFSRGRSWWLILFALYLHLSVFRDSSTEMEISPSIFGRGTLDWNASLVQKNRAMGTFCVFFLTIAWCTSYLSTESLDMRYTLWADSSVYITMFLCCLYGFHLIYNEVSFWYKIAEMGSCIVLALCNIGWLGYSVYQVRKSNE